MKVRYTLKDGEPIPAEKAVDVERLERITVPIHSGDLPRGTLLAIVNKVCGRVPIYPEMGCRCLTEDKAFE